MTNETDKPADEAASGVGSSGWGDEPRVDMGHVLFHVWKRFIGWAVAFVLVASAATWFLTADPDAMSPIRPGAPVAKDEWTPAEGRQLAQWDLARTGFWSAGPPPLTITYGDGRMPSVRQFNRHNPNDPRRVYQSAVAKLQGLYRGSAVVRIDRSTANSGPNRQLDLVAQGLGGANKTAVYYHRALIALWLPRANAAGGIAQLANSSCLGEHQAGDVPIGVQDMRIACFWLRGRLKAAEQPGEGVDDLREAIEEAMSIEIGNPVFAFEAPHIIRTRMANLWCDYLAALLARPGDKPLRGKDLETVTEFVGHGDLLTGEPEILAMLRMLLLRQGEPEKVVRLPEMPQEPVDMNTISGTRTPWQLAAVADAIARGTSQSPVALSGEDQPEFDKWFTQACQRDLLRGGDGTCAPQSPSFAPDWADQFSSTMKGEGVLAKITRGLIWFITMLFVLAFFWAALVSFLLSLRKVRLYQSKMKSFHRADSIDMEREAAGTASGHA